MTMRFSSAVLALTLAAAGCAGRSGESPSVLPPAANPAPQTMLGSHIKHVVIIVQENRSFDNIFSGFPGSDSATTGVTSAGTRIPLKPVNFDVPQDMLHNWTSAHTSWDNGKMDGFNENSFSTGAPVGTYPYAYLKRQLVKPYWALAQQYVLADHMFPSMFGASFTAHLDLIAGTADLQPSLSEVNWPSAQPWGCDAKAGTTSSTVNSHGVVSTSGPFPCFTQFRTMADTLDAAGVSWKYYAPALNTPGGSVWSEFDSIAKVRHGPDWSKIVSPPSTVLTDAKTGQLPDVSWVIPDWADSDHAAAHSDTGPSWVAAVVNSIGQSPDWKSTAIVLVWDDWGGWYDSAAPPQLDWKGLGIRVPAIVVSPYAKKGVVSHTTYEFGSVLKLVEQTFNLPVVGPASFGYTDTRAASMVDVFDFTQKPRAFQKIPAKYPPSHFLKARPSLRAPDDD
jgi:phospholipase C